MEEQCSFTGAVIAELRVWQVWKGLKEITAVVAYEDLATGSRVNSFCQRLSRDLGRSCGITKHMWLLSELRAPQLRSIAANEAAKAHLVIVSVHQGAHLPEEVKAWVDQWVRQKGSQPVVLVAIFDPVYRGTPNLMRLYLQEAATKANMEFLVESEESVENG